MPRPKEINLDVADESLTGFASNVAGAAFTITTTTPTDSLAHQVSVRNDTANDHSAKTVALVGTDANGKAQSETIAAPGASATVESTKYFKTLTSATPSATIGADTFDIGWVDEVASQIVPLNHKGDTAAQVAVDVTGTVNFTVQETFDALQSSLLASQSAKWFDVTALASKTADTASLISKNATGVRVITSSYSSGAEVRMRVLQSDY